MSTLSEPLPSTERLLLLDIRRGFAIFGILVVNMAIFMAPDFLPSHVPRLLPWYDQLVKFLVRFFAQGKFFTIFSFLFGLGFGLQLVRAEAKGNDILSFYPRRLLALLGLGVLHYLLFWEGDILRLYAILGFVLLAFRHRSNRTVFVVAASCFILSVLLSMIVLSMLSTSGTSNPTLSATGIDFVAEARAAYTSSSYLAVLAYHARIFFYDFGYLMLIQGLSVLSLFLLGLYIGRLRLLDRLPEQQGRLRRILVVGLILGLFSNLVYVASKNPAWTGLGYVFAGTALAAFYLSALALLLREEAWRRRLAPLACVGRMALTNYVLQSIVCTTVFYGYGFGQYGKMGPAGGLLLGGLVFGFQIPLSVWWFKHFQYGPLEWLWRVFTYGKRPPFLKKRESQG
jgi:uncharacterized protein